MTSESEKTITEPAKMIAKCVKILILFLLRSTVWL
jgi:hypothetical protein